MSNMTDTSYPPGLELEDRTCPTGCMPSDEKVLEGRDRLHGVPGRFTLVRCRACGLMRTNPRPTPETIGLYYPNDYAPYKPDDNPRTKTRKWRHRAKDRVGRFFGRDTRRLPDVPPGHLLEIGCASGNFLIEAKRRGWSTEGIEFSEAAAETARQRGLHVQTGSVETVVAPQKQADIVAAWMVLEHLHDPLLALGKIRAWLKPDGYFVGVVPDASAFDHRLFGPHWYALQLPTHLYHFTPNSLRLLLYRAGWELVQLRWQPNAMNLLNSLDDWLQEKNRHNLLRVARWLKHAKRAGVLRRWLGWVLGLTRQSGRMEFWARPISKTKAEP
jgi:SAM-dependent methyltransferase